MFAERDRQGHLNTGVPNSVSGSVRPRTEPTMRLSGIILFAVVAIVEAVDKAVLLQPRLLSSAKRIYRLGHEIEELKHEIEEAGKIDPLGFVSEMHARLDQVEGSNCLPDYVQCGWQSFDCVSDLVVCDGHRDCYNGWDESEEVCSHGPIVAGNVFGGMMRWHSCVPFSEHYGSFKITGVMTSKLFPARLGVTAHVIADVPHEHMRFEGDMVGTYIYGKKRLVLVPDRQMPGNLELTTICDFNRGDERTDCRLLLGGSPHECGEAHSILKHRDTHHTRHHGPDHHHHDDRGEDHRGEIVEHHYDIEGHDHAEHFDKDHHHIDHDDDDHYIV